MIDLVQKLSPSQDALLLAEGAFRRLRQRTDLGYLQVPFRENIWLESNAVAERLRNQTEQLVVVGMGGSALGGKALIDILGARTVEFLQNTDPRFVSRLLDNDQTIERSHFMVISKSGNTLEIAAILALLVERLKAKGRDLAEAITVITEPKASPLKDFAQKNKLPMVEHPMDVGGRFSVFTPVGLVPAAFSGLDLGQLRNGTVAVFDQPELIIKLSATFLDSFRQGQSITVFWSYIDRLQSFLPWLVQLWAESLGKAVDREGKPAPSVSTPIGAVGASDQHSVLQQFMEGARDKFILFLSEENPKPNFEIGPDLLPGFEYLNGKTLSQVYDVQSKSTEEALQKAGRSTARLKVSQIDEESVGMLMMLFEVVVGVLGEALNINAFDQPGVELGKKIAKEKLTK